MRMVQQVRSPTVEYGKEADFRAEVFRISGYDPQGFGRGSEENAINHFLILVGDGGNLFRYRKDDVKVLAIEKFGLAALDPLSAGQRLTLRTMAISARPVANALVTALVALLDLSAEGCRSAHLDRRHDAPLRRGHRRAMLLSILFTVATEDIRHFQLGAIHSPAAQKY
jgi:hypothetical protein